MDSPIDSLTEGDAAKSLELEPFLFKAPSTAAIDCSLSESSEERSTDYHQAFLIALCTAIDPLAFFGIVPFVPGMLHGVGGVHQADVGYYAGLIEAVYNMVQMVMMIPFGRVADRYGRKPVLVSSMIGVTVFTALFGLCTSVWQMILVRCLAGAFGGNVVMLRTMLAENCTQKTSARVFGWYSSAKALGLVLGSMVGAAFVDPASFSTTFERIAFFRAYPYALSSFALGSICLAGTVVSCYIRETLDLVHLRKAGGEGRVLIWEVLKSPGVVTALVIYSHVHCLGAAYVSIQAPFVWTDVELGGYGFNDRCIAAYFVFVGVAESAWLLGLYQPLTRRLGSPGVFAISAVLWPCFMAAYPILNEVLRRGWTTAFWILGPVCLLVFSAVIMSYPCADILINDVSPSPEALATFNALSLACANGLRIFSPGIATSLYATGVRSGWVHGHAFWFLFVPWAGLSCVAAYFCPRSKNHIQLAEDIAM